MNPSPLTVTATFRARSGKETELRTALVSLLAPTRKEPGCLNYDLHQSPDEPGRFLFHETWTSKAHLDVHLQTPHLRGLLSRLDDLCAETPVISLWEKLP